MPNSTCDLHLHTLYSDGRASPADLLHHAFNIGLRTLSITDHDNINALPEAHNVAAELGLELIPGIEMTARWDNCPAPQRSNPFSQDIDILGYYFAPKTPAFRAFVQAALEDLRARVTECCAELTRLGYPLSIDDVVQENPYYPGVMQLISALWRKGYADSWNGAYPLFTEAWPAVRHSGHSIEQVIQALHTAGGVAVLAHPVAVQCQPGQWLTSDQLSFLVEVGLDGLEVYHPRLDATARQHFLSLAQEFDLLVTGGSDEHGAAGSFTRLGSQLVTYDQVIAMRERARRYPSQV